jgi:hypothetical protein
MPHITPSARYDMPWKMAITHAFRAFMAFFFPELCFRIDWAKRRRFRDKELAWLGFGAPATGIVADKLVEVCLKGLKKGCGRGSNKAIRKACSEVCSVDLSRVWSKDWSKAVRRVRWRCWSGN